MNILLEEGGNTIWIDPRSVSVVTEIRYYEWTPSWFFRLLGDDSFNYYRFVLHVGASVIYVERDSLEVLEIVRDLVIKVLERGDL